MLKELKIKTSLVYKIRQALKKTNIITWVQIEKIKGLGKITSEKLKNYSFL
jgi:hypothetical protein